MNTISSEDRILDNRNNLDQLPNAHLITIVDQAVCCRPKYKGQQDNKVPAHVHFLLWEI